MNLFDFLTAALISGILATIGLSLYSFLITRSGMANADMIRAVGGFYSRSYEKSYGVGQIVHFIAGIIFSGIYLLIFINFFNNDTGLSFLALGSIAGFIHGFIFSFGMAFLSGQHPLEQFRNADFKSATAHTVGHVIYGLLIGAAITFLNAQGLIDLV